MAPVLATPAQGKSTKASATTSRPGTAARMTRKRATTKDDDDIPTLNTKPSISLFSKGFKSTSGKEKEVKGQRITNGVVVGMTGSDSPYSESLKAFLRIRPPPEGSSSQYLTTPYLEAQGDTDVIMRPLTDPSRPHASKSPNIYSFDKVFHPSVDQATMFTQTTLPFVEKLLHGENGLMLTYGVSNSGKSYTIAGGSGSAERGILPRGIDVIFNSIDGLQSDLPLRCVGVADVEIAEGEEAFARAFDQIRGEAEASTTELIQVDKNYSYAVFVSYTEVYNEKIFDLLDAVLPNSTAPLPTGKSNGELARASSAWALSSSLSLAALANGGGGVLKRRALALKNDPEGNGKYVAGLNEIRVRTRDEALAIFRAGQRARQVFGTLANRESSRSHGIFSIKIVRIHNGAPGDIDGLQVSKLSIVDLAGSERTRNTGTTGERLKEAGNINKSLMVLGQCLEVLRSNQQKMSLASTSGSKKKLAVVPFRHSKLTEIFQNSFVGDGSAVMIVNVNPYDTGYDENAHVMRFSAIAQEVQTVPTSKSGNGFSGGTLKRQISTHFNALKHVVSGTGQGKIKVMVPVVPKVPKSASTSQTSLPQSDIQMVEEELEIVEEDADESSEEEGDIFVDYLFDQIRELKTLLYESEMRNASIEAEVRDEVAQEMQDTLDVMHAEQQRRLQAQVLASERKTDKKIDIVSRTLPRPAQPRFMRAVLSPTPDAVYLRATPEVDANSSYESQTNDTSFESALDGSILTEEESVVEDSDGDPFIVKVGDTTFDSGLDGDGTFDDGLGGDTTRESGIDDEGSTDGEDEVDDEEGSTDGDEEVDDDDDAEQESEDGSESDYSALEFNISSSLSPSPVRTTKRRTTTSTPSRPPPSNKTPARNSKAPLTRGSTDKSQDYSTTDPKKPLGESKGQEVMDGQDGMCGAEGDDDDEIYGLTETVKRKRRTLGTRVVLEEDMVVATGEKSGGVDVRRLGSRPTLDHQ